MFKVCGIEVFYKEKVLDSVSFEIKRGDKVAILGVNGAGKSTLLKAIARVISASGKCYFLDKNLFELSKKEFLKLVSYVEQQTSSTDLSVFDTLLLGRKIYFGLSPKKEDLKKVEEIIKLLKLENIALKKSSEISGGELQKVLIARALLQESEILLLDEPTNNLDIKNQIEILKMIKYSDKTAIMVMHDINLAIEFCNKFIFIKAGKIVKMGGLEIIDEKLLRDVYDINVEICNYKNKKVVIISE